MIYVLAMKGLGRSCDEHLAEGLRTSGDIVEYLLSPAHS
jgi:hypothetical protein